jgi:hypothetical protein
MQNFLTSFAEALSALNDIVSGHRNFSPGIGPYSENYIVQKGIEQMNPPLQDAVYVRPTVGQLNELGLIDYLNPNGGQAKPDLVWKNRIIEFKLCRPSNDNGSLEKSWMTKIFDPVDKSGSAMADAKRLLRHRQEHDQEKKWEHWVVIIGFEKHEEDKYQLDEFFPNLFIHVSQSYLHTNPMETLAVTQVMSDRHRYHQTLKLYAYRY